MSRVLTSEAFMLVNGLDIQHSGEWEDYLEMNAQINGLTREEYAAYYLNTQWQMQCMESIVTLFEAKKVTRKQLDAALGEIIRINQDIKATVLLWKDAKDNGNGAKEKEHIDTLKKLNAEKKEAEKEVEKYIKGLDKNVELDMSESVNERFDSREYDAAHDVKAAIEEYLGDHENLETYKRFEKMSRGKDTAGKKRIIADILMNIEDSPYGDSKLSKAIDQLKRKKEELITYVADSLGGAFESVVNESVSKATKIYQIATPAPQPMLVEELENLFGDDYRNIVTEFAEDEGYESVIMFNLSKSDIKKIENNIADVLIWEYSIKKGKEITESVVTEGKADYMARYKNTNINLKKAYNHLSDEELNQLYLEIGELIADNKLKVKDATFTFEAEETPHGGAFESKVNEGTEVTKDMWDKEWPLKKVFGKDYEANFAKRLEAAMSKAKDEEQAEEWAYKNFKQLPNPAKGMTIDESVTNETRTNKALRPEQLENGLTHWGYTKGTHASKLKALPCRIGRNANDFGGPNHAQELADLNMKDPMVKKFFKPKFKVRADGNYVNDYVELIPKKGYLYRLYIGTGQFEYFCLAIKPGEVYIFRKYDKQYNQYEYFKHEDGMSTRAGVFDFKRHREEEQWKGNKLKPENASHFVSVGWGIMDIGFEYTQLELPFEHLKTYESFVTEKKNLSSSIKDALENGSLNVGGGKVKVSVTNKNQYKIQPYDSLAGGDWTEADLRDNFKDLVDDLNFSLKGRLSFSPVDVTNKEWIIELL